MAWTKRIWVKGACAALLGLAPMFATSSALAADTPKSGGTLNMVVQPEPPTLMLGLNQQGPTQFAASKIYQSLLAYDEKLQPMPSLAKSWTISEDGLTYTFDLYENVKWHDGEPFSADDVVFSADKFLREVHPRLRAIMNDRVESVAAEGKNRVVFKLKQPFSPFIYAFEVSTMPIVPKHVYEGTDYRTNPANNTPIGTGPFKLKEWRRGAFIHLEKNQEYFKPGLPYLDAIYMNVVPDAASIAIAFEQGTVDVLRGGDVENFAVRRLQKLPNVESTTKGWEMFSPNLWMQWNLRKAPFDNKLARQAIMHAIDRNFVLNNIFFGIGKISTGPISSSTLYYDGDVPTYKFDMALAKKMLADAKINPSEHTIRVMPIPYGAVWDRLAEYTKQQLEQLGFKVQLEAVDPGGWSKRVSDWDFDLTFNFLYQYADPAVGVARNYISSNIIKGTPFANNHGYSNPKVDEYFAKAPQVKDEAERQKLYSDAQRILVEDVPVGYLLELQYVTLYRDKIKNLVTSGIGLNETMEKVWIDQ